MGIGAGRGFWTPFGLGRLTARDGSRDALFCLDTCVIRGEELEELA